MDSNKSFHTVISGSLTSANLIYFLMFRIICKDKNATDKTLKPDLATAVEKPCKIGVSPFLSQTNLLGNISS